jgi:hypothetical protein
MEAPANAASATRAVTAERRMEALMLMSFLAFASREIEEAEAAR